MTAPKTYLERYAAGEHEAVWNELRALGPAIRDASHVADAQAVARATMDLVARNVQAIAGNLDAAEYQLLSPAAPPASANVTAHLAALEELVGPLPIAVRAFYETFDGISLAQDVEAEIDDSPVLSSGLLDELGRCDPLVVASLEHVLADARAQRARGVSAVALYVGPDPLCKGTIDDEMPDENPARLLPGGAMDGELTGGGRGNFVDWLRRYVSLGGFAGAIDKADRDHLAAGVVPF